MKEFFSLKEGHILGAYRKVGDSIGRHTDDQVRYLRMAGIVSDQPPKPPKATSKKRRTKEAVAQSPASDETPDGQEKADVD